MSWDDYLNFDAGIDFVVDGIKDFGVAVWEGFEGAGEIVDSIFGEGVGLAALEGAVLGGGISLLTGEDVWKGVGIGTLAGGTLGALDAKFDFFGNNTTAATETPATTSMTGSLLPDPVQSSSGTVAGDVISGSGLFDEMKVQPLEVPASSPAQMTTLDWMKRLYPGQQEDQTRTDGLLAGMFNYTDKEKRDFTMDVLKTGGTLGAQYYLGKMAQEDAEKAAQAAQDREDEIYERDKKTYQEDVISTSVRPKISSSYANNSQSAAYRSAN